MVSRHRSQGEVPETVEMEDTEIPRLGSKGDQLLKEARHGIIQTCHDVQPKQLYKQTCRPERILKRTRMKPIGLGLAALELQTNRSLRSFLGTELIVLFFVSALLLLFLLFLTLLLSYSHHILLP